MPDLGEEKVTGPQHFPVPAYALYPGITTPCDSVAQREIGANNEQAKYINFPGNASGDTIAFYDWYPPENWDLLPIKVKLHWTTELPSATGDDYEIEVSGVARSNDDPIGGAAFGTAVAITDTFIAVDDEHITAQSGAITIGGTLIKFDKIQLKFLRDVSFVTANEGPFQLLGLIIEYGITKGTSVG